MSLVCFNSVRLIFENFHVYLECELKTLLMLDRQNIQFSDRYAEYEFQMCSSTLRVPT